MITRAKISHKNLYTPILSDEVARLVQEDLKGEEEELRLCIAVEDCNSKLFNHEKVSFVYKEEDGDILVATSPEIEVLEKISQTEYFYAATFAKLTLEKYWKIVNHDIEVLQKTPL